MTKLAYWRTNLIQRSAKLQEKKLVMLPLISGWTTRWSHWTLKQWTRFFAKSQLSEVVSWNPHHFHKASRKSVSLAATRAAARGAKFKESPAKLSDGCGRSGNQGCYVPAVWSQSWNSPYMQSFVFTNQHPQFFCTFSVLLRLFFISTPIFPPSVSNFEVL